MTYGYFSIYFRIVLELILKTHVFIVCLMKTQFFIVILYNFDHYSYYFILETFVMFSVFLWFKMIFSDS